MFYFSNDVLLSFQLTYNGDVITPDAEIYIYLGDSVIETGTPVLIGEYYNYVPSISESDILPDYYKSYRFMVTATYIGEEIISNGYFVVHAVNYDNMDNTVVQLSNGDSEIYLSCKDKTLEDCLSQPPVKPQIHSVSMYKINSNACDCIIKR